VPDIHLKYGGSTAARTLACPAWVNLAAQAPKIDRSNADADRGTRLHSVMEGYYANAAPGEDFANYIPDAIDGVELSGEDIEALWSAFNAAEDFLGREDVVEVIAEPFVRSKDDPIQIGGSIDLLGFTADKRTAVLIDWKFGYVPYRDPAQGMLYAACAFDSMPQDFKTVERVVTVIVQPAVSDTAVVVAELTTDGLLDWWEQEFLPAYRRAEAGESDGNPGDHCKYCPAAPYCPAKRAQVAGFLQADPKKISELASGLAQLDQIKDHIKALEAEAFSLLEAGHKVPGWKLVEKRSTRQWIDESAAWDRLRHARGVTKEQYVKESLMSPAQVEKAIGKKRFVDLEQELVHSRSSGTTIAPASDKRQAIIKGSSIPDVISAIINKG
jgi:hypothetical protein